MNCACLLYVCVFRAEKFGVAVSLNDDEKKANRSSRFGGDGSGGGASGNSKLDTALSAPPSKRQKTDAAVRYPSQ